MAGQDCIGWGDAKGNGRVAEGRSSGTSSGEPLWLDKTGAAVGRSRVKGEGQRIKGMLIAQNSVPEIWSPKPGPQNPVPKNPVPEKER